MAVRHLAGMWGALRLLSVHSTPDLPWTAPAGTVATWPALAVIASVLPMALALRRRTVGLAGVRE